MYKKTRKNSSTTVQSIQENMQHAKKLEAVAHSLFHSGNYQPAKTAFERLLPAFEQLNIVIQDHSSIIVNVHIMLGRCNINLGELDQACFALQEGIKKDPGRHDARLHLADVYMRLREYNKAEEILTIILAKEQTRSLTKFKVDFQKMHAEALYYLTFNVN